MLANVSRPIQPAGILLAILLAFPVLWPTTTGEAMTRQPEWTTIAHSDSGRTATPHVASVRVGKQPEATSCSRVPTRDMHLAAEQERGCLEDCMKDAAADYEDCKDETRWWNLIGRLKCLLNYDLHTIACGMLVPCAVLLT